MNPQALGSVGEILQTQPIVNFKSAFIVNGIDLEMSQIEAIGIEVRRRGVETMICHFQYLRRKVNRDLTTPQKQVFVRAPQPQVNQQLKSRLGGFRPLQV